MFKRLFNIPVFIIALALGLLFIFLSDSEEEVVHDYPTPYNIDKIEYRDTVGNIIAGIITTVSQFLNINELAESHRVAGISWDKFYRNIRVELVKCPEDRSLIKTIPIQTQVKKIKN